MKYFSILVLAFICSIASAKEATITPEFIELLKKNHHEKSLGTNNPEAFLSSIKTMADKGDPSAQFLYGIANFQANRSDVKQYLSLSATAGCVGSEAMLAVINMIEKNHEEGIELFKSSANKGDASAQAAISGFYKRGEYGFEKSDIKTYAWLMLAQRQTFSQGGLKSIEQGMSALNLSDADIKKANIEYKALSKKIKKQDYYLCSQMNLDASLAENIEPYLKMQ